MIFLAVVFPWLYFFFRGAIFQGVTCLLLQITLIGWLPAAIWAIMHNSKFEADKRHKEMIKVLKAQQKSE